MAGSIIVYHKASKNITFWNKSSRKMYETLPEIFKAVNA